MNHSRVFFFIIFFIVSAPALALTSPNTFTFSPFYIITTVVFFLLFIWGVTLHKRNKKLTNQTEKLSRIVEQSSLSIVVTDLKGRLNYVNDKFTRETGYNLEDILGKNVSILKAEDKNSELYTGLWETISRGDIWKGDFYNKRKNHETFWEHSNIYPLKDKQGEFDSYVAINENITEQKIEEKQLRLASTVFNCATEAVMITDANNTIVAINQAFTVITGFTKEDVQGETPSILASGHHDHDFYQAMKDDLKNNSLWQGEICNRRKNGEVYYEWLSITVIKNQYDEIDAYVSIFSDITKRKQAENKVYQQANFDALTGLANRNLFIDRFNQTLALAKRNKYKVALLFIDLDGFKKVNDTLGHSKGDILLKKTASRLTATTRESDTVTRLGGDEFAIILAENDGVYGIEKTAKKIQTAISKPFKLQGSEAFVSASIGISVFPDDGKLTDELLKKADSAMYKVKETGRNNYQFYTDKMDKQTALKREMTKELKKSLINKELTILYQPIHDIATNKIVSAEALIRWVHPQKGTLFPEDFLSLAEDCGLINSIGKLVLNEACKQAKMWSIGMLDSPSIAVNLSNHQFHHYDIEKDISTALSANQLPANLLTLEISESLLIEENKHVHAKLSKICELGVNLSVDNFGTGVSSLTYLKRFKIKQLKIDQSLLLDIEFDEEKAAFLAAIVSMAEHLNIHGVTVGLENTKQAALLEKMGCKMLQGNYFNEPLSEEGFLKYLKAFSE